MTETEKMDEEKKNTQKRTRGETKDFVSFAFWGRGWGPNSKSLIAFTGT